MTDNDRLGWIGRMLSKGNAVHFTPVDEGKIKVSVTKNDTVLVSTVHTGLRATIDSMIESGV